MSNKNFIPKKDFDRLAALVKENNAAKDKVLQVLADMVRVNVLSMVVHAKSGHIGASFSILDCLVALYYCIMDCDPKKPDKKDRDRLILSKGHAVPSQYAILASLGYYPMKRLADFRQFGGLQGHPDASNIGIDANTGSLGMGLSKGKGMVFANRIDEISSKVFVVLGDGEWAEGQNWEALQNAVSYNLHELVAIVDRNKFQTDSPVHKIMDIGSIEDKLKTFGWKVLTIAGHDFNSLVETFQAAKNNTSGPMAVILDTVKGKGVSFMEGKIDGWSEQEPYVWHGKCPNKQEFNKAIDELYERIDNLAKQIQLEPVTRIEPECFQVQPGTKPATRVTVGFAEKLVELSDEFKDLVVLDADLERDCLLDEFHRKHPERFFQIGIAEQDMVSTAGGLALSGKIPVVNSYTAFLTSRSNEHIFNNSSEKTHVIYIGHFAGLFPAKPGKSHLGVRDIGCLRSIPNMLMIEPVNAYEAGLAFEYLVRQHKGPGYLRVRNIQAPREVELPDKYKLQLGKGVSLRKGKDIVFVVSCPVLAVNVLEAAEKMANKGISPKVVHLPWLNNISPEYIKDIVKDCKTLISVENHMVCGGVGDEIAAIVSEHCQGVKHKKIGVSDFGQSGETPDVLKHYGLDSESIAKDSLFFYKAAGGRK